MAVQIFTTVVNRPDFVVIQKKLFDKFLLDEYQFHVIDDSIDRDLELEFKYICQNNSIFYYKKLGKILRLQYDNDSLSTDDGLSVFFTTNNVSGVIAIIFQQVQVKQNMEKSSSVCAIIKELKGDVRQWMN